MGTRGPVPKRSDQRRRANKPAEGDITKAPAVGRPDVPEADDGWHPLARDWYESLARSGQSRFYEASDWATARVWAELLSRELRKGRASAQMIASWASGATELLTTEGARRRMRLELERSGAVDEDDDAAVVALHEYQSRLSG